VDVGRRFTRSVVCVRALVAVTLLTSALVVLSTAEPASARGERGRSSGRQPCLGRPQHLKEYAERPTAGFDEGAVELARQGESR
jgi:hypothetical protein